MDTSGMPADDSQGHVLAADAEREATVERLRVACADGRLTVEEMSERSDVAYRARTSAELAAVTRDLPLHRGSEQWPVAVSADSEVSDSYVAIFSGSERKGFWRVPRRSKAVAVFGGVALDMREAEFAGRDVRIEVIAVFGGVEIKVPEGVEVRMTGTAIFGGKSCKVPPAPAGAPVLHVRCTAVFGGVEVKTEPFSGGQRAAVAGPPRPPLE